MSFEITDTESIMIQWDKWREAIAEGDKGSWPRDAFESVLEHFEARIQELEAYKADIENAVKMAMDEQCSLDQKHCTCVPLLRLKVRELEALLLYVEWRGPCDYSMGIHTCPWCGRYAKSEQYGTDGKHAIDCQLKQALEGEGDE